MEPIRSHLPTSIVKELEKAEEEHLKNCPNAEFAIRLASVVVDGILSYLALTGIQKLSRAVEVLLFHSTSSHWTHYFSISSWGEICFKVFFVYAYFIFSTSFYGGTPGKLLMGLRVLRTATGKKLKQREVFIRYLFALISNSLSLGLVYLVMNLREDRATYHDQFTQSTVKRVHGVK